MDDGIKLIVGIGVIVVVMFLFVFGGILFGIPLIIGWLLWQFWLRDYWSSQKQAAWQRRESKETEELYERAQTVFRASDLAREGAREELVRAITNIAFERVDHELRTAAQ